MPDIRLLGRRVVVVGSVAVLIVLGLTVMPYRPVMDRNSAIYAARHAEAEKNVDKRLADTRSRLEALGDDLIAAFRSEHPEASAAQIAEARAIFVTMRNELLNDIRLKSQEIHATYFSVEDLRFMREHHPDPPLRLQTIRIALIQLIHRLEWDRELTDESWRAKYDAMFQEMKRVFERTE